MQLAKARELLGLYEHAASSIPRDDFLDAIRLGIEAMKRISNDRINPGAYRDLPLPGETEGVNNARS